jgi:hypothetical protein
MSSPSFPDSLSSPSFPYITSSASLPITSSLPARAVMISRSLDPSISSSQIVPVIVLPSFLISGSSGSTVLLTHPGEDVDDVDEVLLFSEGELVTCEEVVDSCSAS